MAYHSAVPHAVYFYSNSKGWVTDPLFIDYLMSKLEGEMCEYCTKENNTLYHFPHC
jgi:hypothetical protein